MPWVSPIRAIASNIFEKLSVSLPATIGGAAFRGVTIPHLRLAKRLNSPDLAALVYEAGAANPQITQKKRGSRVDAREPLKLEETYETRPCSIERERWSIDHRLQTLNTLRALR
jgi:hypothetical protein